MSKVSAVGCLLVRGVYMPREGQVTIEPLEGCLVNSDKEPQTLE